jgi:hypothetical protein
MVIRATGYRVRAHGGGHYNTYLALEAADPKLFARHAAYFNACREKRNELSYEMAGVVSEHEANELLNEIPAFEAAVLRWIQTHHAELI